MLTTACFRLGSLTLMMSLLVVGLPCGPGHAEPRAGGVALASHLAIYDLKLAASRGKRALEAVQGRIVYDFSSDCDGYGLKFRQVTALDSGEGKRALSDLRATSWEDAAGKSFRFQSQNFLDDRMIESVDGNAERQSDGVAVRLTKPEGQQFNAGTVVFPTEHIRKILEAAREGKSLLEVSVYDGSDNGHKIYQSLTVIGHGIAADERKPDGVVPGEASLAALGRWPVTISYFDKTEPKGESTPVYSIRFELYDNGISRALVLDYGDFAVKGDMTSLELKATGGACR